LHQRGVYIEAKPFAVGLSHCSTGKSLIDQGPPGKYAGHPDLGAADYRTAFTPRAQWPRGLQLAGMCPAHFRGGDLRARPGCHQRHEASIRATNVNANAGMCGGPFHPEEDFPRQPLAWVELQNNLNPGPLNWAQRIYCAPGQNW